MWIMGKYDPASKVGVPSVLVGKSHTKVLIVSLVCEREDTRHMVFAYVTETWSLVYENNEEE